MLNFVLTKMRIHEVIVFFSFFFLNKGIEAYVDFDPMLVHTCKNIENTSPLLRLKRHLFCDYDPTVRPTTNHNTATEVTMSLMPKILDFDPWASTISLHSWISFGWTDSHLNWNPADYDGITIIHVPSTEIWVPDLSIYNSGDMSMEQTGVPSTNCLLYNTGSVRCVPSVLYVAKCTTDFRNWPYDKHKCTLRFGSWTHTGEEIDVHLENKKGYYMGGYAINKEWDMKVVNSSKVVKKYDCCPNETFPLVLYTISIERHHGVMHSVYVTPAIALMLLTLTVLWLDSRSTERIAMGCVNFICHLLSIIDLHWQLPSNGSNPPSILLFYRDSFALAVFALVLTAVLRTLQNMNIDLPTWINSIVTIVANNRIGRFFILREDDSKSTSIGILANETDEDGDTSKSTPKIKDSPWRQFTTLIEWLSLFCVLFTYIIILACLVLSS